MAPKRSIIAFQPVITAGTWTGALDALTLSAERRRGGGAASPDVTNGDAVALIEAWREPGLNDFPLWSQFAAVAYGWNVAKRTLDNTLLRRDRVMPRQLSEELWQSLRTIAKKRDAVATGPVRLAFDDGAFDSAVVQARVQSELEQDGAVVQFKIPAGCKDKPKLKCRDGWELVFTWSGYVCRNKTTGEVELPRIECDPRYIDDPITAVGKDLARLALIVGFVWLVIKDK